MVLETSSTLARQAHAALSMSPPTIYALCQPRADVLEGRIRDELTPIHKRPTDGGQRIPRDPRQTGELISG